MDMFTTPAARQIAFINTAHVITHYCLLILATAVLGMVTNAPADFGHDYGPILALGTGMFVLYGLGALPMGWLSQRLGRKPLVAAFFLGGGTGMVLAGLANSPLLLGLALALMGAFAAIYHPVGTAMLVEAAGERVGRTVGVNGVFGNFGVALAPVLTALITARLGWQWAFLLPGLFSLLVGLLWLREPMFDALKAAGPRAAFPTIPPEVVRRAIIVLMATAATSGLVFNAYTLVLPKLMQERLANSPSLLPVVGLLAFLVTLCGGLTQFTVGRLIDRHTLKSVFMPLAIILAPCLALLAFAQGLLVLPLAALVAAAVFGQVTVSETLTARYIAPPLRVQLYSIRFTVGFLGAAAASPLVALLHERTGSVAATMLLLAAFAVVILLCAFGFPNRREELEPALWASAPETARLAPAE